MGPVPGTPTYPRILRRKVVPVSPWVSLVEKTVQFGAGEPPQVFHALTQAAYVGVFGITPDGRVPIVRQYRPCVEASTWEFPGGTLEKGERPPRAARRELQEETGWRVRRLVSLGNFYPDTGRLQLDSHAFFARLSRPLKNFRQEPGVEVRLVSLAQLRRMIRRKEFRHQLHIAIYAAALIHGGCLKLNSKGTPR